MPYIAFSYTHLPGPRGGRGRGRGGRKSAAGADAEVAEKEQSEADEAVIDTTHSTHMLLAFEI